MCWVPRRWAHLTFVELARTVAQISNLLYRRFLICCIADFQSADPGQTQGRGKFATLPAGSRRYSRLEICATCKTHHRSERPDGKRRRRGSVEPKRLHPVFKLRQKSQTAGAVICANEPERQKVRRGVPPRRQRSDGWQTPRRAGGRRALQARVHWQRHPAGTDPRSWIPEQAASLGLLIFVECGFDNDAASLKRARTP